MRSSRAAAVERLLASQEKAWPLLAAGLTGLRASRTRPLDVGGSTVLLRHIPHRIASTTAAVDAASVAKRSCFLCRANMPAEEEGLPLDANLTAYANPFPILEKHLTIVHREHRPQAIVGFAEAALLTAESLPGWFVTYNGPACGASAPDHLHFQACSREVFPVERELPARDGAAAREDGRRFFVLRGTEAAPLAARVEGLVATIAAVTGAAAEPLVNLSLWAAGDELTVLVFPRARHRPRVFETGELTVSPAAIDLSGVFVVPLPGDFERMGPDDVRAVFDEVSLAPDLFRAVARRLA